MESNPSDEKDRQAASVTLDVCFGIALVAGGIFALAWIILTPAGFGAASTSIDHATIPIICSSILTLLSAAWLVERIHALRVALRQVRVRFRGPDRITWQRIATVAGLVAYVLGLAHVPFWLATFVLLAAMFLIYGQRSPLAIGLVAGVGAAMLTVIFVHLLKLPI